MESSYTSAIDTYFPLIKKIRKKRIWTIAVTMIVALSVLFFPSHFVVKVSGVIVYEYDAWPLLARVPLLLLILVAEFIVSAVIALPLNTSLYRECDPQKYLALNIALGVRRQMVAVCATGYFYAGDFTQATMYAERMIAKGKIKYVLTGLFNKARCAFMLGDYNTLKSATERFETMLFTAKQPSEKKMAIYQKLLACFHLMCAIADADTEQIETYRKTVQVWNQSKVSEGYLHYVRGVAAYHVGDQDESRYRFMAVKDQCSKTALAQYADTYLAKLK